MMEWVHFQCHKYMYVVYTRRERERDGDEIFYAKKASMKENLFENVHACQTDVEQKQNGK